VISGRFEVVSELGTGHLGTSYEVIHIKSGKRLALKFIYPELVSGGLLARFRTTLKAVRAIQHPGLLRYGDVAVDGGVIYISMEHVPHSGNLLGVLGEYQQNHQSVGLHEACQIVLKILEALKPLHDAGIVHGGIKPENILMKKKKAGPGGRTPIWEIKLTDTAMADLLARTPGISESNYRAPELGLGTGTRPSDIYSIGTILYELLVGQTPRGTYLSPTQLRGDLPIEIDDIIEIALSSNAEDRYQSVDDMAHHIRRAFSSDLAIEKSGSSMRQVLAAISVGVMMIAAYGVYLVVRETPDRLADVRAADEVLRTQARDSTRLLSEEEMAIMVKDHPEMLYIPSGPVVIGRFHQESLDVASQSEPLAHLHNVDAFYIDRFEFPNQLRDPEGQGQRPTARVDWATAERACQQQGKRLCSQEEWEKACKGPGNWIYSYGDTYDLEMCGAGIDDVSEFGKRDSCVSGYGVWGMSGGLREWTETVTGASDTRRVVKGGLRSNNERGSRCAFSVDESSSYADATLAFRCCLSVIDAVE